MGNFRILLIILMVGTVYLYYYTCQMDRRIPIFDDYIISALEINAFTILQAHQQIRLTRRQTFIPNKCIQETLDLKNCIRMNQKECYLINQIITVLAATIFQK